MAKQLLVIDGNSLLHRAFHALPQSLSTSSGQPTNAIYGLAQMLLPLLEEKSPDAALVAFDAPGKTFRDELFEDYKAGRPPTDETLIAQFNLAHELIDALGMTQTEIAGYEADDIIGTVAKKAGAAGFEVLIITGDRDVLQLVDDRISVLATIRGLSETRLYEPDKVYDEYGVRPDQIADYKALVGDSSDNIPGVVGVGPKMAAQLLAQFPHVEELLERLDEVDSGKLAAKLKQSSDQIQLSKKLATIALDSPLGLDIDDFTWEGIQTDQLRQLFARLEFSRLMARLPAQSTNDGEQPAPADLDEVVQAITVAGHCNLAAAWTEDQLRGLALATDEVGPAYLPLAPAKQEDSDGGLFSEDTGGQVPSVVAELLADPAIAKRGCDLKQIATGLDDYDIRLAGCRWDGALADYLIAPQRDQNADALAACYLHEALPPPEQPAERAWQLATMIPRLQAVLDKELEQLELMPLFERVEMPQIEILRDMERAGIALDCERLAQLGEQIQANQEELGKRIYELAGEQFNINSPQQLGEILFKKLGLPEGRRTKTGWSTAADVLEELRGEHEIVGLVLEFRELGKLYSTYIKALLEQVSPETGRVHTTFVQTATATGRLSSRNPNLQNIPKRTELGRSVRACFIAGSPETVLLCADYSQIELRILAHLSGDENLVSAFVAGEDIHKRTAAALFGVSLDEVNRQQRGAAKTVNYAVIYGMGSQALATQLDISREEADKFIEDYFAQLPGVQQYMDQIVRQAYEDGYVQTICGRRRPVPELNSNNRGVQAYGERAAANTPLQGSAADIMKIAMADIAPRLQQASGEARMLLQVHDELVFEVPAEDVAKVSKLTKQMMEEAWELSVPLSVDIKAGRNWRDLEEVS